MSTSNTYKWEADELTLVCPTCQLRLGIVEELAQVMDNPGVRSITTSCL